MIEIEPIEVEDRDSLKFVIKDTFPAFANALRRIILLDVPTIAIEDVIMIENTTSIFDEFIAHRLGMIPLNSEIDDLYMIDECPSCEGKGCNMCTVSLTLTQETDRNHEKMVYSRDLDPLDHRIYPIQDEIPIMKMGKDQRLILEAIARFGTGREHAKWQPVGTIVFRYMPKIKIKPNAKFDQKVIESCPKQNFRVTKGKVEVNNVLDGICEECVQFGFEEGSIEVEYDRNTLIFELESTGALLPENIVLKASEILDKRIDSFIEEFQRVMYEET